jgi:hypothetical protein
MKGLWIPERENGQLRVFNFDCSHGWDIVEQSFHQAVDWPIARQFGQWLLHHDFVPAESRQWVENLSYTRGGLHYLQRKRSKAIDMNEFIDSLPGYTMVRTLQDDHSAQYLYHGKAIVRFTWIPWWAFDSYLIVSYLQLDCSFRASHPFAYCVPQGLLFNEAIPLGLVLDLTENEQIYQSFMDDLIASHVPPPVDVPSKPVLSDQHLGLIAFCRRNNLSHFFCHRHLIEKFSARSPLGLLVARVLREKSARSYHEHRPEYLAQAQAFLDEELVSPKHHRKFLKFLSEDFPHGIWHRAAEGISSCSNHAERFHGAVNRKMPPHGALPTRLAALRDHMLHRYGKFGNGRQRQVDRIIKQLQQCRAAAVLPCPDPDCAYFVAIMCRRFGLQDFPCRHTVQLGNFEVEPLAHPDIVRPPTDRHETVVIDDQTPLPDDFLRRAKGRDPNPNDQSHMLMTWDDLAMMTGGSDPPKDFGPNSPEAVMDRDLRIARDITEGAMHLLGRPRAVDANRSLLFRDIWRDLEQSCRAEPDLDPLAIAAKCNARWWAWAREGRDRPLAVHLWSHSLAPQ